MMKHQIALSDLLAEKFELEAQLTVLRERLALKDSQLRRADSAVDRLRRSLSSAEERCKREARSAEDLRAEVHQLRSATDKKSSEMASMQQRIDELTQRTEVYENVTAELYRWKSDLAEQITTNEDLKSKLISFEKLKRELEEIKMEKALQDEEIILLERCLIDAIRKAMESERRWKNKCDELRAKEARHASLLSELEAKIETLEVIMC
ncbi:hypothetical protein Q1695_013882 [Nippostrongylus brasiliensis]|nr:hypothetical protein Q1695_013882 [Nippostrongylus brasiliensis]